MTTICRSILVLLGALLVPHAADGYQLPLTSAPFGLRNAASVKSTQSTKLRTASRSLSSRLCAQVATRPRDEFIHTQSESTLNELQRALSRTEIAVDEVLLGVEVGHGIRCHSLPHSIQETTSQDQRALQKLVARMHEAAIFSVERPNEEYQLHFTVEEVAAAREEILKEYRAGEKSMTKLAHLLSNRFAEGDYECISSVEAQTENGKFTLSEVVPQHELQGADSLSLAYKQLRNLKVNSAAGEADSEIWEQPRMVDHSIEFESVVSNDACVHRVKAHACGYKDLWKVMSDSIFDINHPDVEADFSAESIFRIRITAEDEEAADKVQKRLAKLVFTDHELREHGLTASASTRALQLVSKWGEGRAMEMVWDKTKVGIEVVTLEEDYRRREVSFKQLIEERKQKRESACSDLEGKSTAYGFSRKMLNWVFSERLDTMHPPAMNKLKVQVHV